MPTELNTEEVVREHLREERDPTREDRWRKTSAEGLIVRMDVNSEMKSVNMNTPARNAEKEGMEERLAPRRKTSGVTNGMRPRYLRYNIWDPNSDFSPNTSDWTLTAKLLEGPPQSALEDETVTKTLDENPDLFKIVTPINVDVFE
jgi:hypothetical protein